MRTIRTVLIAAVTACTVGALAAPVPSADAASLATVSAGAAPRCTITGTAGNDVLRGTARNDVVCGLGGNDTLIGTGGNDTLMGGPGRDTLNGGAGRDSLLGGAGVDRVTSGPGADLCAADPQDTDTDACEVDTTGPAITGISTPSTVAAGGTLVVDFAAADPAGGVTTSVFVGGKSGLVRWCEQGQAGVRTSGTAVSGTYRTTCELPANVVSGDYTVIVDASDVFGNTTTTDGTEFTATDGSADSTAPAITDVVLPDAIGPGSTITIQFRATDETGVKGAIPYLSGSDGNLIGPDGVFYGTPLTNDPVRISGTALDGVYQESERVSATIPPGRYILRFVTLDVLGNHDYEPYLDEQGDEVGFTIS